jgi:hypothetical protein
MIPNLKSTIKNPQSTIQRRSSCKPWSPERAVSSSPTMVAYLYGRDEPALREWIQASQTSEGAQTYLDKCVCAIKNHREYLDFIGQKRLTQLVAERERRAG